MNFKENYQREMNEIEKPADITKQVLNAADVEQETYTEKKNRNVPKNGAIWKTAVAAIAIACVLVLCLQHEKIISFAHSVINHFSVLSINNEDIYFDEIEPIKINMEGYLKGEPASDSWRLFTSYQQMNQLTQLELPCADKVEYREPSISMQSSTQTGRVYADIWYKGVSYYIIGMFKLDDFKEREEWGFGDFGTKEVYQYGDGKYAYFVKEELDEPFHTVYFVEGNILFNMCFNYSDNIDGPTANKKQVKELLKLFGREN